MKTETRGRIIDGQRVRWTSTGKGISRVLSGIVQGTDVTNPPGERYIVLVDKANDLKVEPFRRTPYRSVVDKANPRAKRLKPAEAV